jgi:Stage II sporulation protein E (SpoIIE)
MDERRRSDTTGFYRQRNADAGRRTTSWILRQRPDQQPPPPPPLLAPSYQGELPGPLLERLMVDPLFQVMSLDRQHWICPYTARAVPAPAGRLPAAKSYLEQSGVWRSLEPLPWTRLNLESWRLDIASRIATEPRLRLFSRQGRGWLNPYSGEMVPEVTLDDGVLSPRTLVRMAQVLSTCPAAGSGTMLPSEEISRRFAAANQLGLPAGRPTTEVLWIGDGTPASGSPTTTHPSTGISPTTAHPPSGAQRSLASTPDDSSDLRQARKVQERSLTSLPEIPGVDLGVHFAPVSGVSGDFYHVATLPDGQLFFAIGDVSGHGVQAALVVASALKTLRFVLRAESEPVAIALAFNDEMREDLLPGQFISLFIAVLDPQTRQLTALCCGHHPALVINLERSHPLQRLGRSGMAIGLGSRAVLERLLRPVAMTLEPGDYLVQTTDGIIEANRTDQTPWGEGRLMGGLLARAGDDRAQDMADGIVQDCLAWAKQPVADDLTVLVLALVKSESI